MYLIFNNDGSLKLSNIRDYVMKGNSNVNFIYVAVDGYNNTDSTAIVNITRPDEEVIALPTLSSEFKYNNTTYYGWVATLDNTCTALAGLLNINVSVERNESLLATYSFKLVVNDTSIAGESNITLAQFRSLLATISGMRINYLGNYESLEFLNDLVIPYGMYGFNVNNLGYLLNYYVDNETNKDYQTIFTANNTNVSFISRHKENGVWTEWQTQSLGEGFVDLSSNQTIAGIKTFTQPIQTTFGMKPGNSPYADIGTSSDLYQNIYVKKVIASTIKDLYGSEQVNVEDIIKNIEEVKNIKDLLYETIIDIETATFDNLNVATINRTDSDHPIVSNQYAGLKEVGAFSEVKAIMSSYTFTGNEIWNEGTGGYGFAIYNFVSSNGLKPVSSNNDIPNLSISIYTTTKASDITNSLIDNAISINTSGSLLVRDTSVATTSVMAQKMAGKTIYFATNENEIVSARPTKLTAYGYNLFDGELEQGRLSNGQPVDSQWNIRSKNYINAFGGKQYIIEENNQDGFKNRYISEYDKNYNFIQEISAGAFNQNKYTFTTSANTRYIKVVYFTDSSRNPNGITPNSVKDVCVHNASVDLGYQSYVEPQTINLTLPQQFISAGTSKDIVKAVAKSNGLYDLVHVRNVDIIDMGTLSYSYNATTKRFSSNDLAPLAKAPATNATPFNGLCGQYETKDFSSVIAGGTNMAISLSITSVLYMTNDNYTDASSLKTSLMGVPLQYEKLKPTETVIATNLTEEQLKLILQRGGTLVANESGCDFSLDVVAYKPIQ